MVSADIFRGRYRESLETAKAIPSGTPLPVVTAASGWQIMCFCQGIGSWCKCNPAGSRSMIGIRKRLFKIFSGQSPVTIRRQCSASSTRRINSASLNCHWLKHGEQRGRVLHENGAAIGVRAFVADFVFARARQAPWVLAAHVHRRDGGVRSGDVRGEANGQGSSQRGTAAGEHFGEPSNSSLARWSSLPLSEEDAASAHKAWFWNGHSASVVIRCDAGGYWRGIVELAEVVAVPSCFGGWGVVVVRQSGAAVLTGRSRPFDGYDVAGLAD